MAIDPETVKVNIVAENSSETATDEGQRIDSVEFALEVEFGQIAFSVAAPHFNVWCPEKSMIFARGPRDTRYSYFRIRNLIDLGEFAQAVLTHQGGNQ